MGVKLTQKTIKLPEATFRVRQATVLTSNRRYDPETIWQGLQSELDNYTEHFLPTLDPGISRWFEICLKGGKWEECPDPRRS